MDDVNRQEISHWVAAAQDGSPEAFGELHRRYVALVHGVLLSRFRPAIAEELTQECFLLAFRKIGQLRDHSKFAPWIAAIARHLDAADERFGHIPDSIDEPVDPGNDPEAAVDADKVFAALRGLPETYRETLVLRLVEGMSGAEIAAATDLTPESVRVNLHRGMKKLREQLGIEPLSLPTRDELK